MLLHGGEKDWLKKLMEERGAAGCIKISEANMEIPVEHLEPHPLQPRRVLNPEEVLQLTETIAIYGLSGPLLVTPRPDSAERFYILDGTRRWNAVKSLEWEKVICNVARMEDDELILGLMLAMDGARQGFDPIEKGIALKQLREMLKIGQRALAKLISMPQAEISRYEKLNESLCNEVINTYHKSADSRLSLNHLRELARLVGHPEQQQKFYQEAMKNKWATKKLRAEAKAYLAGAQDGHQNDSKMKFQTSVFEVSIKAKNAGELQPETVCSNVGELVQGIFAWLGIKGEDVAKWYEEMAGITRKRCWEKRAQVEVQSVECEAGSG